MLICANAGVLDRRRSQLGPVAVLNWDKSVQVQTSRTVHAAGLMHLTASLSPQISKVGGTVKKNFGRPRRPVPQRHDQVSAYGHKTENLTLYLQYSYEIK